MSVRLPTAGQPHWRRHSLVSYCSNSLLVLSLPLKPPRSPVISDILFENRSSREKVTRLLDALADYGEGFARELTSDDFPHNEGTICVVEESEFCQMDIFTRMTGL
jgi:hypothetical protein